MIYRYNVIVPLKYNRFDITSLNPTSEARYELSECSTTVYDIVFRTFDIPKYPDGYNFEDIMSIKIYTTHGREKTTGIVSAFNGEVDPYVTCEIDGLLVDDEKYAKQFVEEIANKICKELSIVFINHNTNRRLYQPRVEPNWSTTIWKYAEYQPYLTARKMALEEENENERVIRVEDHAIIRDSAYIMSITSLKASEINIRYWLGEVDEELEFLVNEYYLALGSESVKSKFFHLFAMIEFIEQNYVDYNRAEKLFDDYEVQNLTSDINNKISFDKSEKVKSRVIKLLSDITDIGRTQKLLNILIHMEIKTVNTSGVEVPIDKKLLDDIIKIRNKSFHGTLEEEESLGEYSDAVEKLLYINEKIIEFVRQTKHSVKNDKRVLIIGKK